jgi:predicted HicB family RNase H-like nuclease
MNDEVTSKLIVEIPQRLLKKIKIQAIKEERSMRDLVTEILEREV